MNATTVREHSKTHMAFVCIKKYICIHHDKEDKEEDDGETNQEPTTPWTTNIEHLPIKDKRGNHEVEVNEGKWAQSKQGKENSTQKGYMDTHGKQRQTQEKSRGAQI